MNTQEYLLVCLMEEAAEIQKAASKCLRFGFDSVGPNETQSNVVHLIDEINDLHGVVACLAAAELHPLLNDNIISVDKMEAKAKKLDQYVCYSYDTGCLK